MKAKEFDERFDAGEDMAACFGYGTGAAARRETPARKRRLPGIDDRRTRPRSHPARSHSPVTHKVWIAEKLDRGNHTAA